MGIGKKIGSGAPLVALLIFSEEQGKRTVEQYHLP